MTATGTKRATALLLVTLPIGIGLLAFVLGTGWSGLMYRFTEDGGCFERGYVEFDSAAGATDDR